MVKFEGKVNGQTFDNVADYNQALQEALNNGGLVNASSRTYTSTEEPENEEQQALADSNPEFQQLLDNYDFLPKVCVEDLDKLGPNDNKDIIQDWADRLGIDKAKRIVEYLNNCENEDILNKYRSAMAEIGISMKKLNSQNYVLRNKVNDALKSLDIEMDNTNQRILVAEAELKEAQNNLCNIKSRKNIVLGDKKIGDDAKTILDLENDFYAYIYNNAFSSSTSGDPVYSYCGDSSCSCRTKEARKSDPDTLKALSKLIQDVFDVSLEF